MRARSARRKVMLGAQMRCGTAWNDASILNVSGTGLGLAAPTPPQPGAYVELRRGAYIVVARVVWANGGRFGVRAQDRIIVDAFVAAAAVRSDGPLPDQRGQRKPRPPAERGAASRARSRAFEFVLVAMFGAALAVAAFDGVTRALAEPLGLVSAALG